MSLPRVVVTGLGAITPLGISVRQMWDGFCSGRSGINTIKAFDPGDFACKIAGEVPQYKIQDYVPKSYRKAIKLMSRDIEIAVIAADEAVKHSGLITKAIDPEKVNFEPTRMAVNFGAGLISCDLTELGPAVEKSITDGKFDIHKWGKDGLPAITPLWLLKYLPNMLACHIGIIHDIQGPSNTITCAEVGGYLSICEAAQIIARGSADIALAGGGEAKVNPIIMLRQILIKRATIEHNHDPENACRPFDSNASGCVFGEAAAAVVLENLNNAKIRGAKILAEAAGFGQSTNLNNRFEHLEPDGKGIQIAIRKALDDAEISPDMLDLIIPHGTGIPADDRVEAAAIESALGPAVKNIPVFPTKSMLSNTGAAAGTLDFITAVCAIENGIIPTAKNCDKIASGCNLNITRQPLKKDFRNVLCCGYTYGGQTAAVILKKFEG